MLRRSRLYLFLIASLCCATVQTLGQCGSGTPSFTVNLVGSPSGTYTSPNTTRNDTCCGGLIAGECVKFTIFLDKDAMGINFGFASGAVPPGALFYQIGCDPTVYTVGTPVCLNGAGPHILTFCKPGGNANTYSISSIPKPKMPDSVYVRSGCQHTLSINSLSVPTISWTSVPSNTLHNSFLSCTTGCSLTVVKPTGSVLPAFVDYEVSGYGVAPCQASFFRDTVRVFFYNDLAAPLSPTTICFGSTSAVLSPTPTGGKPPYTYTWSTGSNSSSITVGAGNYTLTLGDQTGCPPVISTVTVGNFTVAITADAGPAIVRCVNDSNVPLSGTVTGASGGTWTAGAGVFLPSASVLTTTYVPTPGEVSSGSVQVFLTTTGNQGCPPGLDTVLVTFQIQPSVSISPSSQTLCANNNISLHTANITGYSATATWSAIGGGTLSPPVGQVTSFIPTPLQVSSGFAQVVVTTTNNGGCAPASDTMDIYFTPAPQVSAGINPTICSSGIAPLNGTVTPAPFSGSWTTLGDGSFGGTGTPTESYSPGPGDIASGTVALVLHATNIGNCNPVTDTLLVSIVPLPSLSVTAPTLICSSFTIVSLSGSVSGAGTGSWSASGSGTFNDAFNLNPSYFLSGPDQQLTSITYSFTSTNNGPCPAVTATASTSVSPQPTVNAGTNYMICSLPGTLALSTGTPTIMGNTTTGSWSTGGSGIIQQSGGYQSGTYAAGASDIVAGTVIFTLTSTNNGVCPPAQDTVCIRIVGSPTVTAGANQTICTTPGTIALNGSISGGLTGDGFWTGTGSGQFIPGPNSVTTQYSVSPADIANGTVILTLNTASAGPCPATGNPLQVTIIQMATVMPGPAQVICSTQPTVALSGTVVSTAGTGTWSSGGVGGITQTGNAGATYSLTQNDIFNGGVTFTLASTSNGPCPAVTNTAAVTIVRQPTLTIAVTPSLCSTSPTAVIGGTVAGGAGTAIWSTTGTGTFTPANTSLAGNYIAGAGDIAGNGVTLTLTSTNHAPCVAATATAFVQIQDPPQASAGNSQTICSSQGTVALTGTVLGTFTTGIWTTGGTGAFVPPNQAAAVYSLSSGDMLTGNVQFTLTSTNNGACPAATSTTQVQVIRPATVTASPAQSVCSTGSIAAVSGTIAGGSGSGVWITTGSGSFLPGNNVLNPGYVFTPADIANGSVQLILSSSNNAPCPVVSDTVMVSFQVPPQVNPGPGQNICSTQPTVALNGTVVSTFNTGKWTSDGTGQLSTTVSPVAVYSVTAADISKGSVVFTLTSTNDGACASVSSTLTLTITRDATVVAGASQTLCSTAGVAFVTGTVTGGSGALQWTSSGTGLFSPSGAVLSPGYSFSQPDVNTGTVTLVLSGINNAPCPVRSDTLLLFVQSPSTVNPGVYQPICSSSPTIQLSGAVAGGKQSGVWIPLNGGKVSPDSTALSGTYSLTAGDVNAGAITLTLASTNNGACEPVSGSVVIPVVQLATVAALPGFSVCSDVQSVQLSATVSGNSGNTSWSSGGAGTLENGTFAQATYTPATGDIQNGTVEFTVTAAANGPCPAVRDTVRMHIRLRPTVIVSPDTSLCANQDSLVLQAEVLNGSGNVLWMTSGNGRFLPANSVEHATYHFGTQDVISGLVNLQFVSQGNGACADVSSGLKLEIRPSPTAGFSASEYTVTLPAEPVVFSNESQGASTFQWEITDGTNSQSVNFTHPFKSVGFYDVTLVAGNTFDCYDTLTRQIKVISTVRAPTAFTPNKDGLNDVFRLYTDGVVEFDLMIFNRWGEMIFRSDHLMKGWDGAFHGKQCQQDVYVWKARIMFFDDNVYEGSGSVTLMR